MLMFKKKLWMGGGNFTLIFKNSQQAKPNHRLFGEFRKSARHIEVLVELREGAGGGGNFIPKNYLAYTASAHFLLIPPHPSSHPKTGSIAITITITITK